MKNEPAEGKDGSSEVSAHETLSPRTRQRPDLLLRQHSMPASTTSGEADSYRVYRGLIAGANQGNIILLRCHKVIILCAEDYIILIMIYYNIKGISQCYFLFLVSRVARWRKHKAETAEVFLSRRNQNKDGILHH